MDADELVNTYLSALERGDVGLAVGLFVPGGRVRSPLYGALPAAQFYPALFADTADAALTLRSVMRGVDADGSAVVSFWFHFDWKLPGGTPAPFDVVDVARLAGDGRIAELNIIYDTVDVRPAFETATGRRSWRTRRWRQRRSRPVRTRTVPRPRLAVARSSPLPLARETNC